MNFSFLKTSLSLEVRTFFQYVLNVRAAWDSSQLRLKQVPHCKNNYLIVAPLCIDVRWRREDPSEMMSSQNECCRQPAEIYCLNRPALLFDLYNTFHSVLVPQRSQLAHL